MMLLKLKQSGISVRLQTLNAIQLLFLAGFQNFSLTLIKAATHFISTTQCDREMHILNSNSTTPRLRLRCHPFLKARGRQFGTGTPQLVQVKDAFHPKELAV
ncbi:uncharacterized protein LOC111482947 isoform X2 [Cucurbita maxima]|uniref:Uncharacterized protein LOC111482947 isoform X2 n=1 Tax=Cucurbita maxima TaxID=3661 RepID=A0A6J1JBH1_CUCMA|nr:uncharacterized protein LOC111482947 isoform X2 [Cucurbita maxima]